MFEGSSPLARGLHFYSLILAADTGIIPARAGSTYSPAPSGCAARDHPRSRGVYFAAFAGRAGLSGSSPLARGLLRRSPGADDRAGIIPARAGSTYKGGFTYADRRDHPRSRGVYATDKWIRRVNGGIIPARAGSTDRTRRHLRGCQDHPRSRGVYKSVSTHSLCSLGSSPLARGLLRVRPGCLFLRGIIPARAGSTCVEGVAHSSQTDHPRSRGVYTVVSMRFSISVGSSPLARGLRLILCRRHRELWDHPRSRGVYRDVAQLAGRDVRIIPARAGSTSANSCEEEADAGSSPLARGLLRQQRGGGGRDRIIPARAGSTILTALSAGRGGDHPRSRGVY